MKRLLQTVSIFTATFMTGNVHAADSATQGIALTATVASTCYIGGSGFSAVNMASKVDATTALIQTGATSTTATAYCNDNITTLKIKSANAGLFDSSRPAILGGSLFAGANDGDGRVLPYSIDGSWGDITAFTTAFNSATAGKSTDVTVISTTAINGTLALNITLQNPNPTYPVLAGAYTDTVTVTLATAP